MQGRGGQKSETDTSHPYPPSAAGVPLLEGGPDVPGGVKASPLKSRDGRGQASPGGPSPTQEATQGTQGQPGTSLEVWPPSPPWALALGLGGQAADMAWSPPHCQALATSSPVTAALQLLMQTAQEAPHLRGAWPGRSLGPYSSLSAARNCEWPLHWHWEFGVFHTLFSPGLPTWPFLDTSGTELRTDPPMPTTGQPRSMVRVGS